MCDGRSWPSWTISSARSVSQTSMPSWRERLVELDLLRRHRLDLDDFGRAVGVRRCRRRSRSLRRHRGPSGPTPPAADDARLELLESAGRSRRTSSLIAAPARRRSSQSARSATAGRVWSDRRRRAAEVGAERGVRERRPRCLRERRRARERRLGTGGSRRRGRCRAGRGQRRPRSTRGSRPGASTRTGERRRDRSPPMCIRHEVSPAVRTSAPEPSTSSHLVRRPSPRTCRRSSRRTSRRTRSTRRDRGRSTSVRPVDRR